MRRGFPPDSGVFFFGLGDFVGGFPAANVHTVKGATRFSGEIGQAGNGFRLRHLRTDTVPSSKPLLSRRPDLGGNGFHQLDVFRMEVRDHLAVVLCQFQHALVHKAVRIGFRDTGIPQAADVHINVPLGGKKLEGADAHLLYSPLYAVFMILLGNEELEPVVNVAVWRYDV